MNPLFEKRTYGISPILSLESPRQGTLFFLKKFLVASSTIFVDVPMCEFLKKLTDKSEYVARPCKHKKVEGRGWKALIINHHDLLIDTASSNELRVVAEEAIQV